VGEASFVYIVPDGPLATVPFAALPGKAEGTVLLEDHPIGYLAHPQDLIPWYDTAPAGKGTLAMGGVDYDTAINETPEGFEAVEVQEQITLFEAFTQAPGGMRFSPLWGTLLEAEACVEFFTEATGEEGRLLQGPFATEEHLRRYAPGKRLLHLATHGFVRLDLTRTVRDGELDPLVLCGLALAGSNRTMGGGSDDGVLTAREAAQLDLEGIQLVILSACETARGTTRAGEGVLGLTSAFRDAGAWTVVSSLWPVSDSATALYMTHFYELVLVQHLPPALALQKAAFELRDMEFEFEGKTIHPFKEPAYWAPFVSYGPWR